jgi:hypothetical protein
MIEQEQRFRWSGLVVRGGVEPPIFRFQAAWLVQVSPPQAT